MLFSTINGSAFNAGARSRAVPMSAVDDWSFYCNITRFVETQANSSWSFTINAQASKLSATAASSSWNWNASGIVITRGVNAIAQDFITWGTTGHARKSAGLSATDGFGWNVNASACAIKRLSAADAWGWNQTGSAFSIRSLSANSSWLYGFSTPQATAFRPMSASSSWSWSSTASIENNAYNLDNPAHSFMRPYQQREFPRWVS